MNDVEKARFNAALDLIQWLDQRIAQQVEYQVEKRLEREREYWRYNVVDLLATKRQHLIALIAEERRVIIDWVKTEVVGLAERNHAIPEDDCESERGCRAHVRPARS
jgi:hypothetical protein